MNFIKLVNKHFDIPAKKILNFKMISFKLHVYNTLTFKGLEFSLLKSPMLDLMRIIMSFEASTFDMKLNVGGGGVTYQTMPVVPPVPLLLDQNQPV